MIEVSGERYIETITFTSISKNFTTISYRTDLSTSNDIPVCDTAVATEYVLGTKSSFGPYVSYPRCKNVETTHQIADPGPLSGLIQFVCGGWSEGEHHRLY